MNWCVEISMTAGIVYVDQISLFYSKDRPDLTFVRAALWF